MKNTNFGKWALGVGVVSVVLLASAESDTIEPLAVGFAVLLAGVVLLYNGQAAYAELKKVVGQ